MWYMNGKGYVCVHIFNFCGKIKDECLTVQNFGNDSLGLAGRLACEKLMQSHEVELRQSCLRSALLGAVMLFSASPCHTEPPCLVASFGEEKIPRVLSSDREAEGLRKHDHCFYSEIYM